MVVFVQTVHPVRHTGIVQKDVVEIRPVHSDRHVALLKMLGRCVYLNVMALWADVLIVKVFVVLMELVVVVVMDVVKMVSVVQVREWNVVVMENFVVRVYAKHKHLTTGNVVIMV